MKIRYLILLSVIIFSCQENSFKIINEQEFTLETELNSLRITTNELLSVDDFFVKDSLVVVQNSREDSLFVIYKLSNFECLSSFGKKGKGPGEYIMPKIIDSPLLDHFLIADFALNRLSFYHLNIDHIENIKFHYNGYLPQSIAYTSDSILIFDTNQQEVRLNKMRKDGNSTTLYDFKELKNKYNHSNIYWGFLGANDSLKRIVYAYQYLRRFDIIDFDGNILQKVKIFPSHEPVINNDRLDVESSMTYFFGVRTTNKSIFLYYVGHTGNELADSLNVTTYIEEYNWDGNPIRRYKLNNFIWGFDILPSEISGENTFIGLDQSNENPFILLTPSIIRN